MDDKQPEKKPVKVLTEEEKAQRYASGQWKRKKDLLKYPPEELSPQQKAQALSIAVRKKKLTLANALLNAMSEEDMAEVAQNIVKRAKNDNGAAQKLLLDYISKHADDKEEGKSEGKSFVININAASTDKPRPVINIDGVEVLGNGEKGSDNPA